MPLAHNGKYIEAENCYGIMTALKVLESFYNNGHEKKKTFIPIVKNITSIVNN